MVALPLKDWHVHQNRLQRSVEGCLQWLVEQVSGMYMHHVRLIVSRLASTEGLQEALFAAHAHEARQLQE